MKKVTLGSTGIEVSRLGIGTGTAHPSGRCAQGLMDKEKLSGLLIFAFEHGITFWDTAGQYGTHHHIKEALKQVKRSDVVITSKLSTSGKKDTIRDFHSSLKELNSEYLDVCLLHGVSTEGELKARRHALETLIEFKEQGKVRALGISSHGLSSLKAVLKIPEIDLVWARINFAGFLMDVQNPGLNDRLAAIPWVKKAAMQILPKKFIPLIRRITESQKVPLGDREEVEKTLKSIHYQSKGIVGMKILAEGKLSNDAKGAIEYVKGLPFIDSFIIGMLNEKEIMENCRTVEGASKGFRGSKVLG